jgi:hypothetical protein
MPPACDNPPFTRVSVLCCVLCCVVLCRGLWALRVDKSKGAATLRSLAYPGYFFYHTLGTARFGGAYFGDGKRNNDIGFMV